MTRSLPRPGSRNRAAIKPRRDRQPRRRRRSPFQRRRWWLLGLPVLGWVTLVALAPNAPGPGETGPDSSFSALGEAGGAFRYVPDAEVYAFDLDPRKVRFGLLEGWDREAEAYADPSALAFVTGPMYERHLESDGREVTVPLGDLKFGRRVWRGRNRSAARQRAFIGIRHDGQVDFGYGELSDARAKAYDTFIGGLHSVYNDLQAAPPSYKGAYSISMGQRIRYYLPRIRMIYGLRQDGRLEMLMSRDGLTLEQTRDLARRRGLVSAYLPDHASKSRLIIPGVKGFTDEDANWISGGATSFVHVPYLLRLSRRGTDLRGTLMADLGLNVRLGNRCTGPINCAQWLGGRLVDRSLAGLNRVMEQGVEPVARMIWSPTTGPYRPSEGPSQSDPAEVGRPPLPEPPITADPLVLRERPQADPVPDRVTGNDLTPAGQALRPGLRPLLPPDLPPPVVIDESAWWPPESGHDRNLNSTVVPDAAVESFAAPPPPPLVSPSPGVSPPAPPPLLPALP